MFRRKKKRLLAVIMVLAIVFACGPAWGAEESRKGTDNPELLIGLIPEENIFRMMERHIPLAEYLSGQIGMKVRFTILSRYGDIIDRFTARRLDGAFFGAFTGYLAYEKLGVVPLVRPLSLEGTSTAQSLIFVRKGSGIRNAADLRGKRAAFVDKATMSGYIYMLYYLKNHGIEDMERYFGEYYFTGNHDSAIYAVLDRRADVGLAKSRIFRKVAAKDPLVAEGLHILSQSEKMPDTILCLRKDISPEVKKALLKALLTMDANPKGAAILKSLDYTGFSEFVRDDFKPIRELLRKAGINIESYRYR